jgi:hypothetical protein
MPPVSERSVQTEAPRNFASPGLDPEVHVFVRKTSKPGDVGGRVKPGQGDRGSDSA